MSDDLPPARKIYTFKPREFDRANPSPGSAASDPSRGDAASAPIDVRDFARQATPSGRILNGSNSPGNRANDVHAILRENLSRANAAGLNDVTLPPPRRSRRKRDYLLGMIAGNLVFIPCTLFSPVFGGAGLVLFNVSFAWIMWVVLDDY